MLSVRTQSLEKAEADLQYEIIRLQETEDRLRQIRGHLNAQGNRTFSAQNLLLSSQITKLEQEAEILKHLRSALERIRQLYMQCERNNISSDIKILVPGSISVAAGQPADIWSKIRCDSGIVARNRMLYPKYEKRIVDESYDKWIRPMMG